MPGIVPSTEYANKHNATSCICFFLSKLFISTFKNGMNKQKMRKHEVKPSCILVIGYMSFIIVLNEKSSYPVATKMPHTTMLQKITSKKSFRNFRRVIFKRHIKQPVISTKQLMPVLPHIPKSHKYSDLEVAGSSVIIYINPLFTTQWCATISIITMMRYNSKLERRSLPPQQQLEKCSCYSTFYQIYLFLFING